MILTIPTIFLEKGKSKYSIKGFPEFSKLELHFKNKPSELAKLFREENNKSILISLDNSIESIMVVDNIVNKFDIPIQILIQSSLDTYVAERLNNIKFSRIFSKQNINNKDIIPIIKYSNFEEKLFENEERILIDMEKKPLKPITTQNNLKISIINSESTTLDLIKLNTINTNIDSVFLGTEYYGIHYAGQTLWRIAEKLQFSI